MMLDMIQDHAHTAVLWIFDTIAWKVKGGCPRVLNFPKWTARSLSIRQELRVSPCNSSVTFNRNYSVMVPISISTFPAAWPFSKYSCALATSSRLNERSLANQGCGFDVTCYPPGNESGKGKSWTQKCLGKRIYVSYQKATCWFLKHFHLCSQLSPVSSVLNSGPAHPAKWPLQV